MLVSLERFFRRLRESKSGNAAILLAFAMPSMIGSAGLAVDVSQWFMWKRELQFAVDQAALAGAWAQTDEATSSAYKARATTELAENLSLTGTIAGTPTVNLANFGTGTNNSVVVTTTATKTLPFVGFLTGRGATVKVSAQAKFANGTSYSSCIIATNEHDSGAITLQGNVTLSQACGIAALSDSPTAIVADGSINITAGDIIARGGIDSDLNTAGNFLHPNVGDLFDPYSALTAPLDTTPRSYACDDTYTPVDGIIKSDVVKVDRRQYTNAGLTTSSSTVPAYPAANDSRWSDTTPNGNNKGYDTVTNTPTTTTLDTLPDGKALNTAYATTASWIDITPLGAATSSHSGSTYTWTWVKDQTLTTTTTTYTQSSTKVNKKTGALASLKPGTYTDLRVTCHTTFEPGIYVISGSTAQLNINSQDSVTGSAVMFVLKDGATISINGGANVNVSAPLKNDLDTILAKTNIVQGSSSTLLAGKLIMEYGSNGTTGTNLNSSKINGNAGLTINGTIYLPHSELDFRGTAGVTSQCLLLAASKIKFSGNTTFTNLCPSNGPNSGAVVSNGSDTVALVG